IKTEPFVLEDNTVRYNGDDAIINHMVEIGQTMPVNVTGVAGEHGGIHNMLLKLQDLQKNMAANDKAGIRSFLDNLDAMNDDLYAAHSAVGVRMQRVDTT